MTKELSIGIATCGRPRVLRRCLKSIKRFTNIPYKLIILDNTKAFTDKIDMSWAKRLADTYIEIEDRKIGCSESNNLIAESCDTEYLMHLDDDVYLESDVISKELDYLKSTDTDIVSCCWYDTGYGDWRECAVKHIYGYKETKSYIYRIFLPYNVAKALGFSFVKSDEALHSMIVDMNVYDKVKWDNNFKWKGDRLDFFLSCKLHGIKIGVVTDTVIHDSKPYLYGTMAREYNGAEARKYFEEKWNLTPIVGW